MLIAMEVVSSQSELQEKFGGQRWLGKIFDKNGQKQVTYLISPLEGIQLGVWFFL